MSCQGHGSGWWAGPAWPRNSGTEGSLGTRPALTACRSTLPGACQCQLGVGSAPWAWEKGQRPVPARDWWRQRDSWAQLRCPVLPSSQPVKWFQPRKPGLRGTEQLVQGDPAHNLVPLKLPPSNTQGTHVLWEMPSDSGVERTWQIQQYLIWGEWKELVTDS